MSGNQPTHAVLSFGPFEADLQTQELKRQGVRLRLPAQSFQILTLLLQKPGDLISREELHQVLWPAETFVDFDKGINVAVNRLRDALGDSADHPRYVETLPRRGYRFIGSLNGAGPVVSARDAPEAALGRIAGWRWLSWKWLGVGITALVLLITAAIVWHARLVPGVRTQKYAIVLGDFANSTGDSIFDGTLREGLSVELEQSPYLKLESAEQIHKTLGMMGKRASAQLTPEIAREVCRRSNSAAALEGSISLIGTRYDLILKAVDCISGDLLASAKAEAKDKSDVLDAVSKVASDMRRKLGESLATVQKYNTPLVQATTSSLQALQFYTLGDQTLTQTSDLTGSLAFFQKAIELDPNFAMAYFAMSDTYSLIGETALSAQYVQKAFDLRERVSEREKLFIEGVYYYFVHGDLIKAQHSFELVTALYPDDVVAHGELASICNALGQYDAGLREYREGLRLDPFNSIFHRHVVLTYLLLNRVDDAAVVAKEAHAKGLDANLGPLLYAIGFYQRDPDEMARHGTGTADKPGEEDLLWGMEIDTAAYFGHLERAREFSYRAADSAVRAGEKETAATYYAVAALREALFGDAYKAREDAATAKRYSPGRDMDFGIALALAYAGDTSAAQTLTDNLAKRSPDDTVVQLNYLPALRAKLAISRSNPQQALDLLGIAGPYELGLPAFGIYNWPNLYPIYVRGDAYLARGRGVEAAAEFQKIVDHRGIVLNEPIGALAHLQLGRADAMQGDTVRAKAAYQDFLTLWKDADPDIPILKQARAEYAKLQ